MFAILAAPYLGRQTRALAEKIQVLERGTDMVLAAHRTPIAASEIWATCEQPRRCRAMAFGRYFMEPPDINEPFG